MTHRPFLRLAPLFAATLLVAVAACSGTGTAGGAGAPSPARYGTNCPTSQPPALGAGETRTVTIATSKGSVVLKITANLSPIAASNFVALASCGFYNGVVFHRVATQQDGTPFVIQGGDPTGTGDGGPGYTIQDEPVTTAYRRGTLAMARSSAANSAGSQFFIVLDDRASSVLSAYNTYAIFGEVTGGMDTVDAIYKAADAEKPSRPIVMDSVTVSNP